MRARGLHLVALVAASGLAACQPVGSVIPTGDALSISYLPPPPPEPAGTPPARPGYSWQPGYWVRQSMTRWGWARGQWVANYPGFTWAPIHWEHSANDVWRLMPGAWLPVQRAS
jgi:hypothetical protein